MSLYVHTDGIIVAHRNIGESDKLVTFFTKDLGRVDAIAKSVRLAKSKLRGHITLFSYVKIFLVSGKDYWRLLDAQRVAAFANSDNINRLGAFSRFFERVVGATCEPNRPLWRLVSNHRFFERDDRYVLLKTRMLASLGMFPDQHELKKFFSPRAVSFFTGNGDVFFLSCPGEMEAMNAGIEKILNASGVI